MKYIELTQGRQALVSDIDFDYLNQFHWSVDGSGYPQRAIKMNGKWRPLRMHRDILKLNPGEHCDHINNDKLDNQRENIRKCTQAENNRNVRNTTRNTSGFRGVTYRKGKWRIKRWCAEIHLNKKKIYLGDYDTKEEAARAYNEAAPKYHGEFALLNQI